MTDRRLGRLPAKSDTRSLHFASFVKGAARATTPPASTSLYWARRAPIPIRSFGNREVGDCTLAKQAVAAMRMERIETRQTPKISDQAVVERYFAMTERLYGGGDTGAYEEDALNNWRNPDLTFRDTKGRPLTIDAYVAVDARNHDEVRRAAWLSAAHGLEVCLNLPLAWSRLAVGRAWDVDRDADGTPRTPIGNYLPGSWGGHSMHMPQYNEIGPVLDMTWDEPQRQLTWEAAAVYMDEVHLVIDSIDGWRKQRVAVDLDGIRDAVNSVSDVRIV